MTELNIIKYNLHVIITDYIRKNLLSFEKFEALFPS